MYIADTAMQSVLLCSHYLMLCTQHCHATIIMQLIFSYCYAASHLLSTVSTIMQPLLLCIICCYVIRQILLFAVRSVMQPSLISDSKQTLLINNQYWDVIFTVSSTQLSSQYYRIQSVL